MKFTPLPGEYIASALMRGNELLCRETLKKKDYLIKRIRVVEGKYSLQMPIFLKEHDIVEQTLYENTLYPLTAALGRKWSLCPLTPSTGWKICLNCVVDDIKLYGTAYIHRRNIPMPVSVCSIHATKLFEDCPVCSVSIDSHKIEALTICSQKFEETKPHLNKPRHLLSIFTSELLSYTGGVLPGYATERYIPWKLNVRCQSKDIRPTTLNKIIKDNFDLDVYYSLSVMPTTDMYLVLACLGYGTAAEYLHVMKNEAASKRLLAEVRAIPAEQNLSGYVFPTL